MEHRNRVINSYPNKFEKYVRLYKRYISKLGNRTQETYLYDISRYLQYCDYAKLEPLYAKMVDIGDFLDFIYSKSKYTKSDNPVSQNKVLSALTKFYDMLIDYEFEIQKNPVKQIPKVKREKNKKPIFLTDEQMKACIAAEDGKFRSRNIAIFCLMGYCGLRVSEVSNLNLEDYDRTAKKIHVIGKGNKHNSIPLPEGLIPILEAAIASRGKTNKPSERAIFISHLYRRISVRGIQDVVKQMYNKVYGMKDEAGNYINDHKFTAHKLRHSYATLLMINGVDIRVVKELMGHSSIETTAIYSHVVESQKEEAIKSIHI